MYKMCLLYISKKKKKLHCTDQKIEKYMYPLSCWSIIYNSHLNSYVKFVSSIVDVIFSDQYDYLLYSKPNGP